MIHSFPFRHADDHRSPSAAFPTEIDSVSRTLGSYVCHFFANFPSRRLDAFGNIYPNDNLCRDATPVLWAVQYNMSAVARHRFGLVRPVAPGKKRSHACALHIWIAATRCRFGRARHVVPGKSAVVPAHSKARFIFAKLFQW
jgi:hypothetical protein